MNKGIPAEQIQEWVRHHIDHMVAGKPGHGDTWYLNMRGGLSELVSACKIYATKENFTKGMIMAADRIVNRAGLHGKMHSAFFYNGQKFYHMTASEGTPRYVAPKAERSDGSESVEKDGWLAYRK